MNPYRSKICRVADDKKAVLIDRSLRTQAIWEVAWECARYVARIFMSNNYSKHNPKYQYTIFQNFVRHYYEVHPVSMHEQLILTLLEKRVGEDFIEIEQSHKEKHTIKFIISVKPELNLFHLVQSVDFYLPYLQSAYKDTFHFKYIIVSDCAQGEYKIMFPEDCIMMWVELFLLLFYKCQLQCVNRHTFTVSKSLFPHFCTLFSQLTDASLYYSHSMQDRLFPILCDSLFVSYNVDDLHNLILDYICK